MFIPGYYFIVGAFGGAFLSGGGSSGQPVLNGDNNAVLNGDGAAVLVA